MQNRRTFLSTSLGSAGVVAWGQTAPLFLSRTAAAAPATTKPGAKETVLVVVQLTGGNDGLNTVVPFADDGYPKLRKALLIPPKDLKKFNDSVGLHPSLTGFAELLDDHALAIVQGVGYPNPNESHFRSMDIWQAASLADELNEGWLGKALAQIPASPAFHVAAPNEQSYYSDLRAGQSPFDHQLGRVSPANVGRQPGRPRPPAPADRARRHAARSRGAATGPGSRRCWTLSAARP